MRTSTVFDWNDLKPFKTSVGQRRDVVDAPSSTLDRLEIHVSTLNAGKESHPQHQHAQEEFIILKEGELEVIINGEATRVGPGSLFFYASNDFHSVRNISAVPATYMVFNYATEATKDAPATPAAQSASPDKLASTVFNWKTLPVRETKVGSVRAFFDSPTVTAQNLEIHATTLRAGVQSHSAHRHADEELIIVREGLIEATIEGKPSVAGPGSIFFFAPHELHGLRNAGYTEASYYVVRIVTEKTAID